MPEEQIIRELLLSDSFTDYYNQQNENVRKKFDYVMNILQKEKVPNIKFVKKLEETDFYEMRVSIGNNEYRTIVFSIDNDNIINASQVLLLNAFMKKSTKDYKKQITLAEQILKSYES